MEKLDAALAALPASSTTLVCCVLPAVMVSLGAGAVVRLITNLAQPVWLSEHKIAVFGVPASVKDVVCMQHDHSNQVHPHRDEARAQAHAVGTSLNRLAFMATAHCLSGCAVGEVLGLVIGTTLKWTNGPTIGLAIVLAFVFGYAFTMVPLLRARLAFGVVMKLALASDTVSILIMETVDNAIMLVIPGAMNAGLDSGLFWISLIAALLVAGAAAFPVNRWLISRGKGHALVHEHHHH